MINRIVLTRIEPCFTANKKTCGETSRVKKEPYIQEQKLQNPSMWEKDTFTASTKTNNLKDKEKENDNNQQDKYTHKGN